MGGPGGRSANSDRLGGPSGESDAAEIAASIELISERLVVEYDPVFRMRATDSERSSWQSCAACSTAFEETVDDPSAQALTIECSHKTLITRGMPCE